MRIPTSRAYGGLRSVVRRRATPKDLERPELGSGGRFGETTDAPTETIPRRRMWLYDPTERNVDTDYGDRLDGDLHGLSMPDEDIVVNDRVSHGGERYEVSRIEHLPDEDTAKLKMFALERRTND